tara:strand:- start:232 stop:609 length:378 start_codon:yes stop_codon:yes gene_type:complete
MEDKIIDFNIEALKRRSQRYLNTGDYDNHEIIEALIVGYEEGLWAIEWADGEPLFKALVGTDDQALERYLERDPLERAGYVFEPDFDLPSENYYVSFEPDSTPGHKPYELDISGWTSEGVWTDEN